MPRGDYSLATRFYKIIKLVTHTRCTKCWDAKVPICRRIPFDSFRFAYSRYVLGYTIRGLISDIVNCRRIPGVFYEKKKKETIVNNVSTKWDIFVVPEIGMLVSLDPCVFEGSYSWIADTSVFRSRRRLQRTSILRAKWEHEDRWSSWFSLTLTNFSPALDPFISSGRTEEYRYFWYPQEKFASTRNFETPDS